MRRPKVVVIPHLGTFGEVGERDVLERAGLEVVVLPTRDEDAAVEAARDADGIICPPHLSERFIRSLERCKVIACSSMGMDDVHGQEIATQKGILLCHVPDVFADEVATHTVTLLLAAARWIVPIAEWVRAGNWGRPDQQRPGGPIHRVVGETLGIIGFGNVGRRVAHRVAGFDMTVLACDPFLPVSEVSAAGAHPASLAQVLQDADFVCLTAPLNTHTRQMIGARELALMKREAIFVNTARGELVDEAALVDALRTGAILGAALDVTEHEPVASDNPLLSLPNVLVTPHMASLSQRAAAERRRRPAHEVAAVLTGHRPRAVWNPAALEKQALR
jgi:D-3-phosphoglycerate dehydrogenase